MKILFCTPYVVVSSQSLFLELAKGFSGKARLRVCAVTPTKFYLISDDEDVSPYTLRFIGEFGLHSFAAISAKTSGLTGYMPHTLRCYDSGQKNRFPVVSIIVEKITLGALKRTAVSYMAL